MNKVSALTEVDKSTVRAVLDEWSRGSLGLRKRARVIRALLDTPNGSIPELARNAGVTSKSCRKITALFLNEGIGALIPRYAKRGRRRDAALESKIRQELEKADAQLTRSEIADRCGTKIWVVHAVAAKCGIVGKRCKQSVIGRNDICRVELCSGHGMLFGYSNRPARLWGKTAASIIELPRKIRRQPDTRILMVLDDLWTLFQLRQRTMASNPGRRVSSFLADIERRWPINDGSFLLLESASVSALPCVMEWRKRHPKCRVQISNPLLRYRDDDAKLKKGVPIDHAAFLGDILPWFLELCAILNWHHPSSRDFSAWDRAKIKLMPTT